MMKTLCMMIAVTSACAFHGYGDPIVADDQPDAGPMPDGAGPPPDGATDATGHCVGFQPLAGVPGSTYFASADTKSWYKSEEYCEMQGAHLVILDDAIEATALNTIAGGDFFIGATDIRTEDYWRDVANRPAPFLPWKPAEPSLANNDDCAVEIHTGAEIGLLDAVDCGPKRRYICECGDGLVGDPIAYTPQ